MWIALNAAEIRMKEQILELLASPQAVKLQSFAQDLVSAPQESPLLAALVGLIAGLLLCGLFMSMHGRRKQRKLANHWQSDLEKLESSHASAVTELQTTRDSLRQQVQTLGNKSSGLDKTLEQDRAELMKERANVKALEHVIEEKNLKIQKTIDDAAHKIAQQQAKQKKLNTLLERRKTEIEQLKTAASAKSSGLPISETLLASLNERDEKQDQQTAERIDQLNQQRQQLLQERDELASREKHYAEQLTDGDDTRAYLDETLVLAEQARTEPAQNPKNSPLAGAEPDTGDLLESDPAESAMGGEFDATQSLDPDSETSSSSLWNKVKTKVSRSAEKVLPD